MASDCQHFRLCYVSFCNVDVFKAARITYVLTMTVTRTCCVSRERCTMSYAAITYDLLMTDVHAGPGPSPPRSRSAHNFIRPQLQA